MTSRVLDAALGLAFPLLAACSGPPPVPHVRGPVAATVTRNGDAVIVRATAGSGTKINALLPPQLELASGRTERLTSASLTADSAYFTAPPQVTLPGNTPLDGALIRASICDSGAAVCRVVTVPL